MSTLPEVRITALATYDTTTDADALVIGVVGGPRALASWGIP